jgi:hypothetical protein
VARVSPGEFAYEVPAAIKKHPEYFAVGEYENYLLDAAAYPRARCLDGSQPGFYIEPGTGASAANWIIHTQGGVRFLPRRAAPRRAALQRATPRRNALRRVALRCRAAQRCCSAVTRAPRRSNPLPNASSIPSRTTAGLVRVRRRLPWPLKDATRQLLLVGARRQLQRRRRRVLARVLCRRRGKRHAGKHGGRESCDV